MKTRAEVDELKRQWKRDPIWDIEETEGFEEYREELIEFHKKWNEECDERWKKEQRKSGGGPAFPSNVISHCQSNGDAIMPVFETKGGMSLRDYFAGQALIGLLIDGCSLAPDSYAIDAYKIADAMIAEMDKDE